MADLRILSLGAGVQSSTLALMIEKAKRHNIGHTVGSSKTVEVKPFINFKSSWERTNA